MREKFKNVKKLEKNIWNKKMYIKLNIYVRQNYFIPLIVKKYIEINQFNKLSYLYFVYKKNMKNLYS